jgi:hypothetical protein
VSDEYDLYDLYDDENSVDSSGDDERRTLS